MPPFRKMLFLITIIAIWFALGRLPDEIFCAFFFLSMPHYFLKSFFCFVLVDNPNAGDVIKIRGSVRSGLVRVWRISLAPVLLLHFLFLLLLIAAVRCAAAIFQVDKRDDFYVVGTCSCLWDPCSEY